MTLLALSTMTVFFAYDMVTDNTTSPFKACAHFCYTEITYILNFNNLKSLSLMNFSTSHYEPMILT